MARRPRKRPHAKDDPTGRLMGLVVLFGFVALALVGRMLYLPTKLAEVLDRNHGGKKKNLHDIALRGAITDISGYALVRSGYHADLMVDPGAVTEVGPAADLLSQAGGLDRGAILAASEKPAPDAKGRRPRQWRHVVMARDLPSDRALAILDLMEGKKTKPVLKGFRLILHPVRETTPGIEAGQLLGLTQVNEIQDSLGLAVLTGESGLEHQFNRELSGTNGLRQADLDARHNPIVITVDERSRTVDGLTLRTTLDATVQRAAVDAMKNLVALHNPDGALILIMDPYTGNILGLASYPFLNPEARKTLASNPEPQRNRAFMLYEPGSTGKVLTLSLALDCGAINDHTLQQCTGVWSFRGKQIRCHLSHVHGTVDARKCIEVSCNKFAGLAALAMGAARLEEGFRRLGVTRSTGSGLDHDVPGRFSYGSDDYLVEGDRGKAKLARVGFGQSYVVTPMAMVRAYSAVANGGLLVTPRLVDALLDSDGKVVRSFPVPAAPRVLQESTTSLMRSYLRTCVEEGTGKMGCMLKEGYTLGAKTGTAQVAGKHGYEEGQRICSFVGFGPTSRPKFCMAVVVQNPKGGTTGAETAAPAFKQVTARLMDYWHVRKDAPATATPLRAASR